MNKEDGKLIDHSSDVEHSGSLASDIIIELADYGFGNLTPRMKNDKGELVPVQIVNTEEGVKNVEKAPPQIESSSLRL